MKNVCVVLRKKVALTDVGTSAVLDAFFLSGYTFDEIRVLPQENEEQVRGCISDLKKQAETILLLTDKTALPVAKRYVSDSFPENSLANSFGAASVYHDENSTLLLLSSDESDTGVAFAKNVCIPFLQKKHGIRYDKITIRAVGANEARVEGLLSQAKSMCGNKATFARTRKFDEDVIEITYDSNAPKILIDDVLRILADGLGDTVYALTDVPLEEQLINVLKLRRRTISVAESFTGGGIAKRLTSVPGASEVYFEGVNAYNENSKVKRLGVTEYTLKTLGAVSDQTAYEMAYGLLNTGDCDVAVATTGLAGPKSDRSMLPVGLCYIAVGTKERIRVYRYIFDGDRKEIAEKAINYALFFAYKQLKDL